MANNLFGTDGIRGVANTFPINADLAMKLGTVIAKFIKQSACSKKQVIIAKDTRISGYLIENALTAGLVSAGCNVILVGPMPTASIPILIKSLRVDMGIMITASHNPYEHNGIKIFDNNSEKLAVKDELDISKRIEKNNLESYLVKPDNLGRARRLDDVQGRYIEYVKLGFPKDLSLSGLRIVVDCANGSAYKIAPTILWELGAEVVAIGNQPDGFNINKFCGSNNPSALMEKVLATRADLGIALDGDADRVVLCDASGKVVAGEHMLAAIVKFYEQKGKLQNQGFVTTQIANGGLESFAQKHSLSIVRCDVGDKFVYEQLKKNNYVVGGEPSGHYILRDFCNCSDGLISALQVLQYVLLNNLKISDLHNLFDLLPQSTNNIPFKGENPLESKAKLKSLDDLKKSYPEHRIIIRKSGTESIIRTFVEGNDKVDQIASELEKVIKS